jgi:death-on-curing protein
MIRFLTLAEVLLIYQDQIRRYGGAYGVRDISLLNSAIHVPQSTFEKRHLHATIPEMAAAYTYHICQNHALLDGNKRVSLASALVFLDLNGYDFQSTEEEAYDMIMSVALGEMDKKMLTDLFARHAVKRAD